MDASPWNLYILIQKDARFVEYNFANTRVRWTQSYVIGFMFRESCLSETQSILGTIVGSSGSVGPSGGLRHTRDVLLARRRQPSPEEAWNRKTP
jgi:hypothetical protein